MQSRTEMPDLLLSTTNGIAMEFIAPTSTFTHFGNVKLSHDKNQLYLEKIANIASSSNVCTIPHAKICYTNTQI